MKNKAAALALGLVAMVGLALAALIPTSATAANQYTQTTTTGTTTTVTTGTTTTVTTPATTTTGATPASITTTPTVPVPSGLPIIVIAAKVGTVLRPDVVIVSNDGGNVVIDDNGVMVPVPAGSTVTFAGDDSAWVANTGDGTGYFYGVSNAASPAARHGHARQTHAVSSHGKIVQTYFSTNTNQVVLKAYSIKTGITKYIKVAGNSYSVIKTSAAHGRVWLKLKTPATTVKTTYSSANFKFLGSILSKLKTEKVKNLRTIVKLVAADGHVYGYVLPLKL